VPSPFVYSTYSFFFSIPSSFLPLPFPILFRLLYSTVLCPHPSSHALPPCLFILRLFPCALLFLSLFLCNFPLSSLLPFFYIADFEVPVRTNHARRCFFFQRYARRVDGLKRSGYMRRAVSLHTRDKLVDAKFSTVDHDAVARTSAPSAGSDRAPRLSHRVCQARAPRRVVNPATMTDNVSVFRQGLPPGDPGAWESERWVKPVMSSWGSGF